MVTAYGFSLCVIVGGMVTFQLLFAPLLFAKLEGPVARRFIRAFFPYYYLYFALLTVVALLCGVAAGHNRDLLLLGLCLLGFVISRQVLMPQANAASDAGQSSRFTLIHRTTVLINTAQLGLFAWLLFTALG